MVRTIAAGHRVAVQVSTTDLGYRLPTDARSYTVGLDSTTLALTTLQGRATAAPFPWAWPIAGIGAMLLLVAGIVLAGWRRRTRATDVVADDVPPIVVDDLVKEYGDSYRAVDGVSFSVERGQVVGLLGPNGAGKTTVLRMMVGLIRPTAGSIRLFGQTVGPGSDNLARVGAFIEGPGLLPHLSGRENLDLFWAATGRPREEADVETALEIAGLGASVDRKVRKYSQGMRQRLAIAQAMLGLPELLILDEPTNGLDPPQIAEMREVMRRYAATGRTVIVSSHLLSEVEQTCSHVVVMHKGRLVTAGSVSELAGAATSTLAVADVAAAQRVLSDAGCRLDRRRVPTSPGRGVPRPHRRGVPVSTENTASTAATRKGVHDRLDALGPRRPSTCVRAGRCGCAWRRCVSCGVVGPRSPQHFWCSSHRSSRSRSR